MKRVLFYTIGGENTASSRVRVFQHLYYFPPSISTRVIVRNPYYPYRSRNPFFRILQGIHVKINLLRLLLHAFFYKNIFIQKVILPKWTLIFMKMLNKNILFDFDDAIFINENNNKIKEKKLHRLGYIIKNASTIFVTNKLNEKFALDCGCRNVKIIVGPVECNRYKPELKDDNDSIVIGWIGSPGTTKYLKLIEKPFADLCAKYPKVSVLLIGASEIELKSVRFTIVSWSLESELDYLKKINIGVMPLENDVWSAGKGGYKLLQYMSLGIPSVASPVGINTEIITDEIGFLADSIESWIQKLECLILDKSKCAAMGLRARQIVTSSYSYEHYNQVLVDSFL